MSANLDSSPSREAVRDEIQHLQRRLREAEARLRGTTSSQDAIPKVLASDGPLAASSQHYLLLLSDSALPLGSFAFSSGLESYLAHTRPKSSFPDFLDFSLSSYASTTLPFVLGAHRDPTHLIELDDALDAAIMCTVGRRASVAQGRALLSIWDRSFAEARPAGSSLDVVTCLKDFALQLRATSSAVSSAGPVVSAHLAPLFGAVASILGMSPQQTAYVFMLSHVKALLSAAVRASIFGPYHGQKVLASTDVQKGIQRAITREWNTKVEDAGQIVPVMDLWIGRHEMLYSRIFNS
ncbi:hypothetical protein BJ875DRAFT_421856 [Amylocarpus encephaloides]|uniref:Urease accessory protein UreF n=1 Tax=Amylocarpus encephaloides TaxID=45428 RepID=A0A9P7YKS5_9HELO|nr:hypothetical protein BJ875DRAFT_421856 [Amylocarpus encephaloides]